MLEQSLPEVAQSACLTIYSFVCAEPSVECCRKGYCHLLARVDHHDSSRDCITMSDIPSTCAWMSHVSTISDYCVCIIGLFLPELQNVINVLLRKKWNLLLADCSGGLQNFLTACRLFWHTMKMIDKKLYRRKLKQDKSFYPFYSSNLDGCNVLHC